MSWLFVCFRVVGVSMLMDILNSQSLCVWNHAANETTFVNGLYTYNDNNGSLGYYEQMDDDCPENDVFLFRQDGAWHIGPWLGDTVAYTARCTSPVYVETPDECNGYWTFLDTDQYDESMVIYPDACPSMEVCGEIFGHYTTNLESNDCVGPFSRLQLESDQVNDIFYAPRLTGNTYLYFSINDFRWICASSLDTILESGQCRNFNLGSDENGIIDYQLHPQWSNFKGILSINDFSWSATQNHTIYIECLPGSTSSPLVNDTSVGTTISETADANTAVKPHFCMLLFVFFTLPLLLIFVF